MRRIAIALVALVLVAASPSAAPAADSLLDTVKQRGEMIVGKLYTVEPYGMGVRHNDSKWRNAVNEAFLDIWDARRYHELYKKWFGQEPEFEIPWYPK